MLHPNLAASVFVNRARRKIGTKLGRHCSKSRIAIPYRPDVDLPFKRFEDPRYLRYEAIKALPTENIVQYNLSTLFSQLDEGYISICNLDGKTEFFSVQDLDSAEEYMQSIAKTTNAYFGLGVFGEKPSRGRGRSDDVRAITALSLDWDLKVKDAGVHSKNDKLPESMDEIMEIVRKAGLPLPTAIINSGNGRYARFHLGKPLLIPSGKADRAKLLIGNFHRRYIKAFADAGRHMDFTGDLARITRNPGTLNHKTDPAKPVTLVSYDPSMLYSIEDLEALIGTENAVVQKRPATKRSSVVQGDREDSNARLPQFDAVAAGCSWVKSCLENLAHLSEPDWFALASIAKPCKDGTELFHDLSAVDPRYNEQEATSKLQRSTGPWKCATIHSQLGFAGCETCAQHGHSLLTSPVQFGHRSPALAELLGAYIYVLDQRTYATLVDDSRISFQTFSDKYSSSLQKNAHQTMIYDQLTRRVNNVDYLPGVRERLVNQTGGSVLNIWKASPLLPGKGDCQIILDHLEYIIPLQEERDHYIKMLAHALQKPRLKIRHAAMISGGQGTGKSFLGKLLGILFGASNVVTAAGQSILERWTDDFGNKQVLIWEESGVGDQLQAYERLKPWITEETARVEQKHIPTYNARTARLYLGFTNQAVPIKIEADDRRFFFIKSPATPRDATYYSRLWNEGMGQAPAFLHYLLNLDIASFNPDAPPPVTQAKLELIENSRSSLVREIKSMIGENEFPFGGDVFTRDDLLGALRGRVGFKANLSGSSVTQAMTELEFMPLRQQRLGDGATRARLWAWRNQQKWKSASAGELREEYSRRRPPFD